MTYDPPPQGRKECEVSVKPLLEVNDVGELQGLVGFLYDILDDIDTEDDVCKSNDRKYREHVQKLHLKRLVRIKSNGYDLFVNLEPKVGETQWTHDSTLYTKG